MQALDRRIAVKAGTEVRRLEFFIIKIQITRDRFI